MTEIPTEEPRPPAQWCIEPDGSLEIEQDEDGLLLTVHLDPNQTLELLQYLQTHLREPRT